jgi:hypothetical protein
MSLDPQLVELRRSLGRFRRRVWLRRIVRDGSLILAAVAAVELALAVIARLMPFDLHLAAAVAVVIVGLVALAVDTVRVRPTLAEAALAVDSEDGLNDRVSTALSLAASKPELASAEPTSSTDADADRPDAAVYEHLVRLQRRDALSALLSADPRGLRIPLPRRQSAATAFCALMLIPALLLPNAQNDVIAQREQMRNEAEKQAQRLDETATHLQEGHNAPDPASRSRRRAAQACPAAARSPRGPQHEPGAPRLARGRDSQPARSGQRAARCRDQLPVALAQPGCDRQRQQSAGRSPEDERGSQRPQDPAFPR